MSHSIVSVENLNFGYRIRHASAGSLKQMFINSLKGINSDVSVDAIRGLSIEVKKGEVLAIVGNNGAGKSTLLKLLSGILPPTSGTVRVSGRVAPLIELGAGFNPELTGAENIVLFGMLLGNKKAKMEENLTAIAKWAGLTDAINLPMRTYSTGMISRLGFAVATFQQCELLIIDEVLSVGDSDFQKKSMSRMTELISMGEATILVSHDLNLVGEFATKVLWLDHGKEMMVGDPEEVIDAYRRH